MSITATPERNGVTRCAVSVAGSPVGVVASEAEPSGRSGVLGPDSLVMVCSVGRWIVAGRAPAPHRSAGTARE